MARASWNDDVYIHGANLPDGLSKWSLVLLPCSVAHYGVAVLALADFDRHANELRIPPVGAALIDCARAYLYA